MVVKRKNAQVSAPRPMRKGVASSGSRVLKKHNVPSGPEEGHIGAMENQVGRTLPPTGDDDEPKQG